MEVFDLVIGCFSFKNLSPPQIYKAFSSLRGTFVFKNIILKETIKYKVL